MKKLKKDEQLWLDWIKENNNARGMTLGKGRPHDNRVIQSLIAKNIIMPIYGRPELTSDEYAILGDEDENGLAMFVDHCDNSVVGACYYGLRVDRIKDEDYLKNGFDSAHENGIETAREFYPNDFERCYWMEQAITKSAMAMYD